MINSGVFSNKWLIIGCLVSLILIFFMGKSYGKSIPPPNVDLDGKTDNEGYLVSQLSDADIRYITERVFKDMEGLNWFGDHENELWYEVANLSDRDLARLINEWNKTFYKRHNEKLSEAISNEHFIDVGELITALQRRIIRIENV